MKRRSFLKGLAAAGVVLPTGAWFPSCSADKPEGLSWDFDKVIDRFGSWSIKYGRLENLGEKGSTKLSMWIADMDFMTDPLVSKALRDRVDNYVLGYTRTPVEFLDSVVSWEKRMHGYDVAREWVAPCPGVIASLNQAYLTFTEPGDTIVLQTPVYDHFRIYIEKMGRIPVENPLIEENGRYRMDFDGLERIFEEGSKVLVLCNPQNPVGILWDKETLATLAGICERHGVMVFSDEIHSDLTLRGGKHIPFCSVSEAAARVGLIFGSPTKSFNFAGLSGTAWCIIPDRVKREKLLGTLEKSKLDEPSIMSLTATIAAYSHEPVWLDAVKKYIEGNLDLVYDFFKDNDLGIKAVMPEASFLIWLDCRSLGLSQAELMSRFSDDAGIILNDGISYGTGGEGFVRMNVGCPRSVVEEALSRIRKTFG